MSDDLNINDVPEDQPEVIMEFTTREETIAACYNSIAAVDGIDTEAWGGDMYGKMKRRIQKRCVKILDALVKEMYDETFDDDEKE